MLERTLKNCKENAAIVIEQVKQLSFTDSQSKLEALCGSSKHNPSTEAFFAETAYRHGEKLADEKLIIDRNGCIMNILPVIEVRKKGKSWVCDELRCNIDTVVIEKYQDFLNSLSEWTMGNVEELKKLRDYMKENQTTYEYEGNEINLNEDDILTFYRKAFLKLQKNTSVVPIHSCVCCESFESVRDMTEIAKMRKPINTTIWVAVIKDA